MAAFAGVPSPPELEVFGVCAGAADPESVGDAVGDTGAGELFVADGSYMVHTLV